VGQRCGKKKKTGSPLEQKKPFKSLPLATGSENRSFTDLVAV
jgi:hypothetical protein